PANWKIDMWFQLKAYFHFLFHAKNQHGIHSPFVYKLITACFYDRKKYPAYRDLKTYREKWNRDKGKIRFNRKKIRLLYRIRRFFGPTTILETGALQFWAALALSPGRSPRVFSLVPIADRPLSEKNISHLENLAILDESSWETALDSLSIKTLDFVFVGNGSIFPSLWEGFQKVLSFHHPKSVFIFEGIHQSAEKEGDWSAS